MAERKYVVFKLGAEEFGIDIMKVKEVTEGRETVRVPNCPDFVEGIINLRGDVTPIINLKKKFALDKGENESMSNRIIVLNLKDKLIGFMVDDASQVISVDTSQIVSPPDMVSGIEKAYIEGIGKIGDKMVIMLDLLKVLNESEQQEIIDMEL